MIEEGNVHELVQEMLPVLERNDPNDVLAALLACFTLVAAMQCENCRKTIVEELEEHVPEILREANRLAAERAFKPSCH
jgi:hypothetical protein